MAIGIRISLDGIDVKVATPEQLAYSSEFPPPLVAETNTGIFTYVYDTAITASTTRNLLTFRHGYTYKPTSICMVTNGAVWDGSTFTIPAPYYVGFTEFNIHAYTDSTNFYIDMINPQVYDTTPDNVTYTFKYYIFTDDSLF